MAVRYVDSLSDFDGILRAERPSGFVRLVHDDMRAAAPEVAEARRVLEVFPALPAFLVRGTLEGDGDGDAEERTAAFLKDQGVTDKLLLLPVWWALWQGRIAVYRQGNAIVRDLLSMFGGKDPVGGVVDFLEKTLKVERGTGKLPGRKRKTGSRESPRLEDEPRARDPWEVLGVPRNASPEQVRKAYRALCSRFHPDKVATQAKSVQDGAHKKIVEINAAYEALRPHAKHNG